MRSSETDMRFWLEQAEAEVGQRRLTWAAVRHSLIPLALTGEGLP